MLSNSNLICRFRGRPLVTKSRLALWCTIHCLHRTSNPLTFQLLNIEPFSVHNSTTVSQSSLTLRLWQVMSGSKTCDYSEDSPLPTTVTPCLSNATPVQLLETRRQTGLLSTVNSFVLLEIPLSHQNPHWSQDLSGLWAHQDHQPIFTGLPGLYSCCLCFPFPCWGTPGLEHCDADFLFAESPFLCPPPPSPAVLPAWNLWNSSSLYL